jgi:glyoxylase-like metal-dependent hydrolase (beta-lactamase superfamily II)
MKIGDRIHGFMWSSSTANNCNTYLIDGPERVLVDPGHAHLFRHVQAGLDALGVPAGGIGLVCCTHCHPDHLEAVRLLRDNGTIMAMHEADWRLVSTVLHPAADHLPPELAAFRPDLFLAEGELDVGGMLLNVIHTPGHSPGSVCLYWPEEKTLWTGDLVFEAGVGRTDLPGGDGRLLLESVSRVAALDVERLLPGHGPIVEGKEAVVENFRFLDRVLRNYV